MPDTRNILILGVTLFLLAAVNSCKEQTNDSAKGETFESSVNKDSLQNQVWQMEERYWVYVDKIDTEAYKRLWHDEFIGYPSFGNGVSNKSGIAVWIPELHKDTSLSFSYKLYKKAVNAIDDVVIVFYDADEIWTDRKNNVVRKETFKFTHTWKKYDDTWVILGGMAAKKI
jgi:hypothetical protein